MPQIAQEGTRRGPWSVKEDNMRRLAVFNQMSRTVVLGRGRTMFEGVMGE